MAKREPLGAMEIAAKQSEKLEEILFGTPKTQNQKEEMKMTKVEFVQNGEVAVVTVNGAGRVEIAREGMGVEVLAPQHSLDAVVNNFKANGWTQKEDKQAASAALQNIPVSVQNDVDGYLKLHEQIAALNKVLDGYKKNIRSYMDTNDIKSISGTHGKQVYLQDAKASNSTSLYSDYEMAPVVATLQDNELIRQVTEIRINAEKLEALLKLDKLPKDKVEEIKSLKIVKEGTPRFSVKK